MVKIIKNEISETDLSTIKQLLVVKKEDISKSLTPDLVSYESGDEDGIDMAQINTLNEVSNQLSQRDKAMFRKINFALSRIENGEYGMCGECEEPIAVKRLLAFPLASTCISCAEQNELKEKGFGK